MEKMKTSDQWKTYHVYTAFGVLCRKIRMGRGVRQAIWRFRSEVQEMVKEGELEGIAKGVDVAEGCTFEIIQEIAGMISAPTSEIFTLINRLEEIENEKRGR